MTIDLTWYHTPEEFRQLILKDIEREAKKIGTGFSTKKKDKEYFALNY